MSIIGYSLVPEEVIFWPVVPFTKFSFLVLSDCSSVLLSGLLSRFGDLVGPLSPPPLPGSLQVG